MKKRRIVAFALATTMAFSSFSSLSFAEESVSPAAAEAITKAADEAKASADDEVVSDGALSANAAEPFMRGGMITNVAEDAEWKSTVTGDAGSPAKVNGNATYEGTGENAKYTGVPYYSVLEKDNGSVDMRMGLFNDEGEILESIGKIASGSDGLTMYYKELTAADNFELSATAKVNALANDNNQVAFGLALRDQMRPMTNYNSSTNMIFVGPVQMANVGKSNGMLKVMSRNEKKYINADPSSDNSMATFLNEASEAPKAGDVINFKLRKNGNAITLTYGDQTPVTVYDFITFTDDLYVGPFVSRAADVTFSNIEFKELDCDYTSIEVVNEPDQTTYVLGSDLDTSGLKVVGTRADGTKVTLTEDDYDIAGYEENKDTAGTYPITVVCGDATDTFDVTVEPLKITNLKVTYPTARNVFYTGSKFSDAGLVVTVTKNNGETEILDSDKYILKMGDKVIDDSVYFDTDDIGTQTITVSYTDQDPNVLPNDKTDTFDIKVVEASTDSLIIAALPAKTTYYLGEEFESAGLVVRAKYDLADTSKYQALSESEYTIEGFDSSAPAEKQTLTVVLKRDPSKTVSFDIVVKERKAVAPELSTYPRTTFEVGEAYDADGMIASTVYDSEDVEPMDNSVYYYFDGSKYYTTVAPDDDAKANADGTYTVDEATAKAADYYIDLSNYDSSKAGTTNVSIVFKNFSPINLDVTIKENERFIWKPALMGASSMGFPDAVPPTGPAEIYVNGTQVTGDTYDECVGIMEDGHMTNVKNVRLNAWDKAGKSSTGTDGLAYYYTRVEADKNFTLSADIKINRYIIDPDDAATQEEMAKTRKDAEELLGRTITDEEVIDMSRDGQENFGMQAMDAVSLFAKDGLGDDNMITIKAQDAQTDKYGEPINIWEAYLKGLKAVDYKGTTRGVTDTNVAAGFASNLVLAGGYSGATYSRDLKATNYYKNTHSNRINLMVKKGISDYMLPKNSTRMDPYPTTDTVPLKNETYNITLQRINYGYKVTTYNYQTGETKSNYSFDTTDKLQDLLVTQEDKDNVWVGFHAARWADINVSNIEMYETDPSTDPVISNLTEETYSPNITVASSLFTSSSDYTLVLKANTKSGGLVTIRQGDEEVYTDMPVTKKGTSYPITLEPDSKTEFTVTFTPSRVDKCVSYEPVVIRFVVTNKALDSELKDLYVSPDGSVKTGDGSRENPIDLESAIGLCDLGQKIIMLDGTYNISDKITIPLTNTGTASARKYLVADEGANPVIDLRKLTGGFTISGYYWVFDGITICNGAGNTKSFELGGNHVIVKNCTFHDNGDTGLQISRTNTSDATIAEWPGYNLVESCESYNNADPSKNNADGFAAKLTSGYGNIFKDCISHHNVDDGWDLYTKVATGAIGPVTLENCIAYKQGYKLDEDGTDSIWSDPDGCNGFKTGGENVGVMHYLKDCITFDNIGNGIDSNFNPHLKVRNVVSYANEKHNVSLYSATPSNYAFDIEGLISYNAPTADRLGTISYDETISYKNATTADVDNEGTKVSAEISPILSASNYYAYGFDGSEGADEQFADEATFNEHYGFQNYVEDGSKLTYETLKELAGGTYDLNSYNSELEKVDDSFFKSLNRDDSMTDGRYSRKSDGSFEHGDFLALATPYVHDPEDEIDYSKVEIAETTTSEATEATTSEVTTKKSSSRGGGGGGSVSTSGNSSSKAAGKLTETTTTVDTDETTEATTTEAKSFVTPSGVTITPPVSTGRKPNFTDIAHRAWAVDSINKLASAGIVSGVSNDKFAPDAYSKRADFVVMLVKTFGLTGPATDNFDDVLPGKYYAESLAIAKEAGIATGYGDGNFGPEKTITRQDMMVLVAKSLEFAGIELNDDTAVLDSYADASSISAYAKPYVAALVNAGLASGTDKGIEPMALITRAQMSVLVANVYDVVLEKANEAE